MLLSTEFIESQLEDEELINSIKSIKRQIFLIQNLVNEFSTYARLPKANITKLNLSEICLVYIEEYKRNFDKYFTFSYCATKKSGTFFNYVASYT